MEKVYQFKNNFKMEDFSRLKPGNSETGEGKKEKPPRGAVLGWDLQLF